MMNSRLRKIQTTYPHLKSQPLRLHLLFNRLKDSVFYLSLLLFLGSLLRCENEEPQSPLDFRQQPRSSETLGRLQQTMIGGAAVATVENSGFVIVDGDCSGTLVRNDMVITAKHCLYAEDHSPITYPFVVSMGSQRSQVSRTGSIEYPSGLDVALLQLDTPMTVSKDGYLISKGFRQPVYQGYGTNLVGKTVDCYGYGRYTVTDGDSFGTLRYAPLQVYSFSGGGLGLIYHANSSGQFRWKGDSGSSCFYNGELIDVLSGSHVNKDGLGHYTGFIDNYSESITDFRDWLTHYLNAPYAPGKYSCWVKAEHCAVHDVEFACEIPADSENSPDYVFELKQSDGITFIEIARSSAPYPWPGMPHGFHSSTEPGTKYTYRVCIENKDGRACGPEFINWTTSTCSPPLLPPHPPRCPGPTCPKIELSLKTTEKVINSHGKKLIPLLKLI